jgi:hypothetical protein
MRRKKTTPREISIMAFWTKRDLMMKVSASIPMH